MAEDAGLPLFDELMHQGLLKEDKFAFYLSQNKDEDSELMFGGVNQDKFDGELECHEVVD